MELRLLLLATLLLHVCAVAACFPPDRLALREFAASLQSGPILGWESDECCSWHGVVCNSANHTAARISKLMLPNKALWGAIPKAICSLSALSTLDLSYNDLIGPIPTCLGHNLTNLRYIDLSFNWNLNGSMLPVAALPHLAYSDLSGTGLNSIAPFQTPQLRTLLLNFIWQLANIEAGPQISEWLCGLKSLEVFSVSDGNNLGGEMPHPASCKSPSLNLTILDVSNNQFGGPLPAWLSLFSNLQVLRLSGNNFNSSAIPPQWQNLTRLTVLELSGSTSATSDLHPKPTNYYTSLLPNGLFRLPLETLTLSSLGLANQDIPCSQLSLLNATLQSLDFSSNLLTDAHALQCLAHNNFTALAYLDLSQNPLAFNLGLAIPPSLSRGLNLTSCQLQGELTDQFFGLLRSMGELADDGEIYPHISLAHNSFYGTLPLGIGVSAHVQLLDLSYNNFTGPIPPSLGNMSDLFFLLLQNNNLEGEVPRELGNIAPLRGVFLKNNKLTKWLPTFNLSILDLSYNRLEGDLEQTFFGPGHPMSNLVILLLGHNRLSGAIPADLNDTAAPWLSIIQLSNNNLTGTIPHTLFKLFPSLTGHNYEYVISFFFESIFTVVVKNLELSYDSRSPVFTYLDLSSNSLYGSIPESLGDLSRLMYLNLSRNQLTGTIPSSLSNLSSLESLDLSYNRLQGSIPPSLSQLTNLEVFNVSFNEELSGRIPTNSPQTEQNTSYIGDPKLCGEPYLQRCSDMGAGAVPGHWPEEDHHEIDHSESLLMKWVNEWIAIPGFCLGIVVGFSGALWVLRFIRFV